jgi:hypothetical protein
MGDRVGLLFPRDHGRAALLLWRDKLEARLHEWYGWIYFTAAFASMVIINGIVTFMLTPGRWVQNHQVWTGFFNPTYFPSLFSLILISLIGFIYSNNLTLSQTPERWKAKYFADPSGWSLNFSEPTLIPRFLHFFVAAIAAGGLLLIFLALARRNQDHEYARGISQLGAKAFVFATMAQFVVGIWFLVSLPRDLRILFLGDNPIATALLVVGVAGGVAAIFLMSEALRKQSIGLAAYYVSGLVAVVIAAMAIMRDTLRDAYLAPTIVLINSRLGRSGRCFRCSSRCSWVG